VALLVGAVNLMELLPLLVVLERRRGVEVLIKLNILAPRSQYLHRRSPEMANKRGFAETGTAVVCSCWSEGSNVFLSWARLVVGDCWPAKKFILRSPAERADWWPEPAGMKDEG
jgi:hypothetical protein